MLRPMVIIYSPAQRVQQIMGIEMSERKAISFSSHLIIRLHSVVQPARFTDDWYAPIAQRQELTDPAGLEF